MSGFSFQAHCGQAEQKLSSVPTTGPKWPSYLGIDLSLNNNNDNRTNPLEVWETDFVAASMSPFGNIGQGLSRLLSSLAKQAAYTDLSLPSLAQPDPRVLAARTAMHLERFRAMVAVACARGTMQVFLGGMKRGESDSADMQLFGFQADREAGNCGGEVEEEEEEIPEGDDGGSDGDVSEREGVMGAEQTVVVRGGGFVSV